MATVNVNYEQQRIRCGKTGCRCNTTDQASWHGPYWYAYWNDPKTGKKRSRYVGKNFDPPTRERPDVAGEQRAAPAADEWSDEHETRAERERRRREQARRDREQREREHQAQREQREREHQAQREQRERERQRHAPPPRPAQDDLDAARLGVSPGVGRDELKRAYKRAALEHHPDRYQGAKARERQEAIMKEINAAYARMKKRRGW